VPLARIPSRVSGAFLAVEDKRFYQHKGIDYRRALGAAARDLQTLSYDQGFSTLTMQLARNVFPDQLSREKTIRRKLWEIVLARRIEQEFSKGEVLEMYLNQIYLGNGFYGVEAAAQGYFGKSATQLNNPEAALLAALPKAPTSYDPRRRAAAAIRRRNLVLGLMADAGVITRARAEEARATPLRLVPPLEARGAAPYFIAAVRRELRERFGADAETDGLRVYTTLDPPMQQAAERELRQQIEAVEAGKFGTFRHPECMPTKPESCLQGMFVAMDARTGDVRALVGGRDFRISQFDRVVQAKRQAGSAFKPFVYATALGAGVPMTTTLVGPGAMAGSGGYYPADHVADSLPLDMRGSLRVSSNRAAVVLGERAGVGRVIRTARDLGITTPIQEYPSTFLGAADVIPLELVASFSVFANTGMVVQPRIIRRVEDARGRPLWEVPVRSRQGLPPAVAFLTTQLMEEVVNRGTGAGVRTAGLPYNVPAAGKTGTTNDAADVWFVGVTPDLVAGVWLGFDEPKRILRGASGGGLAAPVWGKVVAEYYRTRPVPAPWRAPANLVQVQIDRESGQLATDDCPPEQLTGEYFLAGTEPTEQCALHLNTGLDGWLQRAVQGLGDVFRGGRPAPPLEPAPAPAIPPR
jgi:penicillin-binding protein 1A